MSWHPEDPRSWGGWHAARSPLGPAPAHLGLGASRPAAVRQPARPPPAHRRPTRRRPAHHGRGPGPVPAQPGHAAGLGRRPSIAARHRPALVEARPRLPGRHRRGDRGRGWAGAGPGPPLLRLHRLAAPDRRRPARLPGARGVPVAPAPPGRPGRPAGRRAEPGRPPPGHRPGRGPQATARGHPADGGGRPSGRDGARRPLRPGRPRASRSTAISAGPTSTAWSSCPGSCRAAPG